MPLASKSMSRLRQIPGHETDYNDYNDGICYEHNAMVISLRLIKELQVEMVLYPVDQCTYIEQDRCFQHLVE
jgi:hypothetical protein